MLFRAGILFFCLALISVGCRSRRGFGNEAVQASVLPVKELGRRCLLWVDDLRTPEQVNWLERTFAPAFLVRSWYRWGEPHPDKAYDARLPLVWQAEERGFRVGGGGSLSVVNGRDLASSAFREEWLAVDLAGQPIRKGNDLFLGTLSAPGFRSYLVDEALEQVAAGVRELHFGETAGAIFHDDWTLGIKGDSGYFQWLLQRFSHLDGIAWNDRFGPLGQRVRDQRFPTRAELSAARAEDIKKLFSAFGKPGSWSGNMETGEKGFLADQYARNLGSFLRELRLRLKERGREDVLVSIWGVPPWYDDLTEKPDYVITSPPDSRWGLNWASDPAFDFARQRDRILREVRADVMRAAPAPLVIAIDHPSPWTDFLGLPDARQAELWKEWQSLAHEAGALLLLRSYSLERDKLGPRTERMVKNLCRSQADVGVANDVR